MKSATLLKALGPFALAANKHAISESYRSLQLSPTIVRGYASYALLELDIDLPLTSDTDAPVYVDAEAFISVLKSLPNDEIKLSNISGVLHWNCGSAKGKLASYVVKQGIADLDFKARSNAVWEPTEAFYDALDIGSISCTNIALTSAGMYGIVIDNRTTLAVYSSDNISVAGAECGEPIPGAPDTITLSPPAVALLRACMAYGEAACVMWANASEVCLETGSLRAVIKQVPALKHDFQELLSKYADVQLLVPLPPERVALFIRRAVALAESKRAAQVDISAVDGHLSLAFAEGTASSEEYYLVEGTQVPDIEPIRIDASRLARVLEHVGYIAFDHVDRRALLFIGGDDDSRFYYLLSGTNQ